MKSCNSISDPNKPFSGEKVFLYKAFPGNSISCSNKKKLKSFCLGSEMASFVFFGKTMCLMRSEYISFKKDCSLSYVVLYFLNMTKLF